MPTDVVATLTPIGQGGDYTTDLDDMCSGEARDLVSLDERAILQIEGDWSAATDTTQVVSLAAATGWVVDSTRYVRITTAPPARWEGFLDTSKYILDVTPVSGACLQLGVSFTQVDGLQIRRNGGVVGDGISVVSSGTGYQLSNGIVIGNATGSAWYAGENESYAFNMVFANASSGIFTNGGIGEERVYHNCTIASTNFGINYNGGLGAGSQAINCGFSSVGTQFPSGAPVVNTTNSTATPGFINAAARDYRLVLGDVVWGGQGTDISADPILPVTEDAIGEPRPAVPAIGAFEPLSDDEFDPLFFGAGLL